MQSALASKPSLDEIKAKCRSIIDGHAHREVLREGDVRAWIKEVVGTHGDLAVWHAVRAGGFGGSEIGVLVRNHMGHRADHQASAHDIVEGKLLRRVPESETWHMRRGHDNEPRHAEWFYGKYAAVRDKEAFDLLSASTGLRPWMRYSPDEVALLPADSPNAKLGGRKLIRVLADYKAPSKVEDDEEIAFQYSCQLHQGALICAKQGIHLDALMLSQFDWAGWQLKDDWVPYSADLSRALLHAGDHYWGHVMRGEVPRYLVRPLFEDNAALKERFEQVASRVAQMKAMVKALSDQIKVDWEPIAEELQKTRLAGAKISLGTLSVTAVTLVEHEKVAAVLDEMEERSQAQAAEQSRLTGVTVKPEFLADSFLKKGSKISFTAEGAEDMARAFKQLGGNPKAFASRKFDEAKVFELLLANDIDPEALMEEQIRTAPDKGLMEQAREVVKATYGIRSEGVVDAQSFSHQAQEEGEVATATAAVAADADADAASGQQNDRAGRDTERSAPRSIST